MQRPLTPGHKTIHTGIQHPQASVPLGARPHGTPLQQIQRNEVEIGTAFHSNCDPIYLSLNSGPSLCQVTEVAHHLHHINRLKVSHWDLCPLFAHHTFTATLFQTSASVDSEGTARVSDMGSAFVEPTPLAWSEVLHELIRCSAPELVNPQAFGLSEPQVTKASDVYALGVFASQVEACTHPDSLTVDSKCWS